MIFEYTNICVRDDIGMLSKSKGQVMRVAAAFHVLFEVKCTGQAVIAGNTEDVLYQLIVCRNLMYPNSYKVNVT